MAGMPVADAVALAVRAPVRISGYDGSAVGPVDAPVRLRLRSPKAIAYLVTAPSQLGLARGYVSGEIDLDTPGHTPPDHYLALRALAGAAAARPSPREWLAVLQAVGPAALRWVELPPQEVATRRLLAGLRKHTTRRDAAAISHHYDVSNRFYSWMLGPSMAYTCAVYRSEEATLDQAQAEKFDLVCRKLALRPGMRLLDVGCGWGGMVLHAVRHYGVAALGVTLARRQAAWAQKTIVEQGLADRAEVRHQDYRDVPETGFDAVSSIGLTEHIGIRNLDTYAAFLAGKLVAGGRLLNHCITRPDEDSKAVQRRGFINRYVFPDGELPGPARVMGAFERAGLEMRHEENLREHYTRTLAAWSENLDAHWEEAVDEVGVGTARVWALYLAGSRVSFERNWLQLHQVLFAKSDEQGQSGLPLRPDWRP